MKTEKQDNTVLVELDGKKLKYNLDEFGDKQNFLTDEGVLKLEEWKIDLVKNHGVELDELRS